MPYLKLTNPKIHKSPLLGYTMANPGDIVIVTTKDSSYQGILIESSDEASMIKLKSGYNIGVLKKNAKIRVLERKKEESIKDIPLIHNPSLPTISILHTGGTIASKVDYETGAVISRFTPKELLNLFPQIAKMANCNSKLIANMWSENMRFSHYNLLAKEIEEEINRGSTGIIITHGTDTLHYTSAALSFMLSDLKIPVILVAAQRSSDRPSTDAEVNLLNAVYFITTTDFAGVAICMHRDENDEDSWILPATKTRKMHTSRRDAFRPINTHEIASVNLRKCTIEWSGDEYQKRHGGKLIIHPFKENIKVGILYQRTNMHAQEFLSFKKYQGLVIVSTGLGNLPIIESDNLTQENKKIAVALKILLKNDVIIALAPQTIYGRLHQHVYENEVKQQEMGILAHLNDMTIETTYIKLAWLLSNYSKEEAKKLLLKNLRGELTERSEEGDFLH